MHYQQPVGSSFEFDAEADEVALDLGIEIVELSRREEGRIFIEPTHGGGGHLHHGHGWRDAENRVGSPGNPRGHCLGVGLRSHRPSHDDPSDLI